MKARSSASVVRFSPAWIASRPRCGVVQERFSTVFPAKMIAQAQTGLTVMALIGTVVIGFIAVLLEESGMENVRCPSCRRPLAPSGEIVIDGAPLGVYQCDACTRPWTFDGQTFEAALTFALTEDGNLVDPESGQPIGD